MPNSVIKKCGGPAWPLGCIVVPSPGTPVPLSSLIDANNNSAPGTPTLGYPNAGNEYTPNLAGLSISGYHQGGNNNAAMVPNTGNIYLLVPKAGNGSGNASDAGCMVAIIPSTAQYFFPPDFFAGLFSPYTLYLDADNANDAGLCVGYTQSGS